MTSLFEYYDISLFNDGLQDADEFVCGTEYEIEDVLYLKLPGMGKTSYGSLSLPSEHPNWIGNFGLVHDGSLRNHGIEIVTKPMNYDAALAAFKTLHEGLTLGPDPYTVRTSTHVHVNVASLSIEQVKHMVLTYALLEPVFFAQVKEYRKHNIHCVPLNYTILPTLYNKSLVDLVKNWSKYSALNLLPIRTQGTVEFRHLHGTGDFEEYKNWLTLLANLWSFAYSESPDTLKQMLLDKQTPEQICQTVLGITPVNIDFSTSIIDVKLAF